MLRASASTRNRSILDRAITAVWTLAVAVAFFNALALIIGMLWIRPPLVRDVVANVHSIDELVRQVDRHSRPGRCLLIVPYEQNTDQMRFLFSPTLSALQIRYSFYPTPVDIAFPSITEAEKAHYPCIIVWNSPQDYKVIFRDKVRIAPESGLRAAPTRETPVTVLNLVMGAFSVLTSICAGVLLLSWTQSPAPFRRPLARLALAHLVGAGAITWVTMLVAVCFHRLTVLPVYILVVAGLVLRRKQLGHYLYGNQSVYDGFALTGSAADQPSPPAADRQDNRRPVRLALVVTTLAGIAFVLVTARLGLLYDSFAIWAIKAKCFFYSSNLNVLWENGKPLISPPDAHPLTLSYCYHLNYPLLVPLQMWWGHVHIGRVLDSWVQILGFLFYIDLLVLVYAACRESLQSVWTWVGVALVATCPVLDTFTIVGYADQILATYFFSSAVCLGHYVLLRDVRYRTPLLWLLVSTLLVKNEGMVWAAAAALIMIVFELKSSARLAAISATIVGGSHVPWTIFKYRHRLRMGVEEPMLPMRRLLTELPHRLLHIFKRYLSELTAILLLPSPTAFSTIPEGLLIVLIPLGLVQALRRKVGFSLLLFGLTAVQFAAYTWIFLSVADMQYELTTFLWRGIIHVFPTLIVACLLGCFALPTALVDKAIGDPSERE